MKHTQRDRTSVVVDLGELGQKSFLCTIIIYRQSNEQLQTRTTQAQR